MWCGKCYTSEHCADFFMSDEENRYAEEGDEDRLAAGWKTRTGDVRKYAEARDGDNLMVSFECDFCVFAKVTGRLSELNNEKDLHLLGCIRRVILDAFWSRARGTVVANAGRFREMMSLSAGLGFEPPYDPPGPRPSFDHCGNKVAILMVEKSLHAGRHSEKYTQFDTIRKIKSTHSNQSRGGKTANSISLAMTDSKGSGYDRFSTEVCGSLWFQRFVLGCRKRMGQGWRPNQAISTPIVLKRLSLVETRVMSSCDPIEKRRLVMAGTYFCFCYVVSLRSPEGLLVDIPGLRKFGEKSDVHVVIPLLGQGKGEDHARQHLMHCVNVTGSGIPVRVWLVRLRKVNESMGRSIGPAFLNPVTLKQSTTAEMNEVFLDLLTEIHEDDKDLFGVTIQSASDIHDHYNVFRSFRRGSETRATEMNVSEGDRCIVNRWRKEEKAGSSKIALPIDQSYVDVSLAKEPFLRYTAAM